MYLPRVKHFWGEKLVSDIFRFLIAQKGISDKTSKIMDKTIVSDILPENEQPNLQTLLTDNQNTALNIIHNT
jgi:hypothetical protein